ncbi:MAG: hypothetical protein F6K40_02250 [Okeania sp. SIO3I5]|nr:hypothetical protein [Okeania sp. SIO3I5]NEQ35193.1 hypothetical protein [Okeania sp. SIO3I5]
MFIEPIEDLLLGGVGGVAGVGGVRGVGGVGSVVRKGLKKCKVVNIL